MTNFGKGMVAWIVLFLIGWNTVDATELKIDNTSNEPIFVLIAYRSGGSISEGWFRIDNNKSQSFSAEDGWDMHIRVERKEKEINWRNYQTYANFPARSKDRFKVSVNPLNPKVKLFQWGENLQENSNKEGFDLPQGFDVRRFFRVGPGRHGLDVTPP